MSLLSSGVRLPAMWVLIAIIVGGGLFGFAGMILGVPTAAVLYVLASELIKRRLNKKGYDEATVGMPGGIGRTKMRIFKSRKAAAEKTDIGAETAGTSMDTMPGSADAPLDQNKD